MVIFYYSSLLCRQMNTALQTTCECPFSSATGKYLCLKHKFFCIWQQIKNTTDDSNYSIANQTSWVGLGQAACNQFIIIPVALSIQEKHWLGFLKLPVSMQVENETAISWISGKEEFWAVWFFKEQGNRWTMCPYFESSGDYFLLNTKCPCITATL